MACTLFLSVPVTTPAVVVTQPPKVLQPTKAVIVTKITTPTPIVVTPRFNETQQMLLDSFMGGCSPDGSQHAYCLCVGEELVTRYNTEQIAGMDAESPQFMEAIEHCIHLYDY
jgi:hypothetical protein